MCIATARLVVGALLSWGIFPNSVTACAAPIISRTVRHLNEAPYVDRRDQRRAQAEAATTLAVCHAAEDSAMPIALNDDELSAVMDGARPLAPQDRDAFLRAIAHQLSTCADVGPGTVHRLVRETQRLYFDPPKFADSMSAPRSRRLG
jgi:hypothetical protein